MKSNKASLPLELLFYLPFLMQKILRSWGEGFMQDLYQDLYLSS